MLCDRCGATNAATAPFCENCGVSLTQRQDVSRPVSEPEQAPADDGEERDEIPLEELPTARVPAIVVPSSFAPVSQLPFTTDFPLETEVEQAQSDKDVTLLAAPSPLVQPGKGMFGLPTRSKSGWLSSRVGRHTPPEQPIAGAPSEIATSPGLTSQREPSTQPEPNEAQTPPGQVAVSAPPEQDEDIAQANTSVFSTHPEQRELSPAVKTSAMPDATMSLAPAGVSTPPQSNPVPAQPVMYAPPWQSGIGGPPAGEAWSQYQAQAPVPPERLGNVYPGPGASARAGAQDVASVGVAPFPTPSSAKGEINTLLQPLPRWIMIAGPLAGTALLLSLVFVNRDWATGALIAMVVAMTLAILLGIAAGVRLMLGMLKENNPHRRAQVISTVLLIGLLFLFSGVAVSQQNSLHMVQGRYLESHQNWALAIAEYQAAGERSNAAVDVARSYNEWGEAQIGQQDYAGAVTNFTLVLQNYQGVPDAFSRAQRDNVRAYLGWASQAAQQQNYADATAHYDTLLAQNYCDAACKSSAQPKDASAYYQFAEQLLSQRQYVRAASAYQTLAGRFPNAPEAGKIHAHYAQALWGKGQQELTSACADALSTYRLLARVFADTGQGKQATVALAQPVAVKGHFTQTIPGAPFHPTVYLVQGLFVGIQQDQFPPLLAQAPAASIHSDGTFTFPSVAQGTYELVWSNDSTLHFYYAFSGKRVLYTARVGPLCTYNYGDINQAIPTQTK